MCTVKGTLPTILSDPRTCRGLEHERVGLPQQSTGQQGVDIRSEEEAEVGVWGLQRMQPFLQTGEPPRAEVDISQQHPTPVLTAT